MFAMTSFLINESGDKATWFYEHKMIANANRLQTIIITENHLKNIAVKYRRLW